MLSVTQNIWSGGGLPGSIVHCFLQSLDVGGWFFLGVHGTMEKVDFGAHATARRSELGASFNRHGSAQNLTQVVWERHVEVMHSGCIDLGTGVVAWKTISVSI